MGSAAALWAIHLHSHDPSARTALPFAIAVLLIVASTFTAYPEIATGIVLVVLLVIEVRLAARSAHVPVGPATAT